MRLTTGLAGSRTWTGRTPVNDLLLTALFFLAVFNPAVFVLLLGGLAESQNARDSLLKILPGFGLSLVILTLAALLSDDILDFLDLSLSTFQIATGTLVIFGALQAFLGVGLGRTGLSTIWANVAMLLWLVSPSPLTLAISVSSGDGIGFAVGAFVSAAVAGLLLAVIWFGWRSGETLILGWIQRIFAAASAIAAVDLIRQGVESV